MPTSRNAPGLADLTVSEALQGGIPHLSVNPDFRLPLAERLAVAAVAELLNHGALHPASSLLDLTPADLVPEMEARA